MSTEEIGVQPMTDDESPALGEGEDIDLDGGEEASKEEQFKKRLKESIQVVREPAGPLRVRLTITVPGDLVAQRSNEQFTELRKDAQVPGFRKGHAPMRLVEKRFATEVDDQLKTQLIGSGYFAAVEKEALVPLGDPLFRIQTGEGPTSGEESDSPVGATKLMGLDEALKHLEIPRDGDLTFSCELELRPVFTLPDLNGIPVQRPEIASPDVLMERDLGRILDRFGTRIDVNDGAREHDALTGKCNICVGDETLYSEAEEQAWVRPQVFSEIFFESFLASAVGGKVGETIKAENNIPDDHDKVELRGKTAKLEFQIQKISRHVPAQLTEEFARQRGFDDIEDFRQNILRRVEERSGEIADRDMKDQIIDWLIEHTPLELPDGLSTRQTYWFLRRRAAELIEEGVPESELMQRIDAMRSSVRQEAERDLRRVFILEKIAEEMKVEVGEESLNNAIAAIAARNGQRFDRVRDELARTDRLEGLYLTIRDFTVLTRLLKNATIAPLAGPKTSEETP